MHKIKQAAEHTGFSIDTLRFYDKEGIAKPSQRSKAGYRVYTDDDIERLQFIQSCKALGFTLDDIRQLLAIKVNPEHSSCGDVKTLTAEKIEQIDKQIAQLTQLKSAISKLHQACSGGPESAKHCTILQALANNEVDAA